MDDGAHQPGVHDLKGPTPQQQPQRQSRPLRRSQQQPYDLSLLQPSAGAHHHEIDACPISTPSILIVNSCSGQIVSATPEAERLLGVWASVDHGTHFVGGGHSRMQTAGAERKWEHSGGKGAASHVGAAGRLLSEFVAPVLPSSVPGPDSSPSDEEAPVTTSRLHLVEIPPLPFGEGRRWAYACAHHIATDSAEYDIWLLEDVTKVCGALANGLDPASLLKTLGRMGVNPRRFYGGPATPISPHDVDLERGSVHWDIGGRAKVSVVGFRDQNDEIPPDDKNEGDNNENLAQGSSTASTNSPLRSTKSRPRSKTEPIPYRAPESSAAVHQAHQSRRSGRLHVTDDSPASPSSVSSHTSASSVPLTTSALITLLSARDYVLTATEQRMVAMAGLVGLGKLPMWIFARLRTVLTAMDPPSFQSAHHPPLPRHVNDGATVGQQQLGEAERDQSTIAIQMNSFGRVQMAYPLTRFLGRSTEVLMNRFLMRFVFEEDVGRLCKGMSRCVKEGSCVMFVRWDWRSQQEGASGINRLGFPDVGASQKEEEEGPMFKESNIEDFSRYSTAESTSSADSPTLSAESTIADIPPLAQPPAERATAATPIILTSAPIRSISDPPIPSFRRERRQSSSEPCSSTVLQMTGLRDPVSPVAGSSSTSAFSSSDTIATLPPPLPAVSVVAENEPPPQIRLVWTRVLATLVAHPGECMYILALVTPLPTSTGLMPDRSWISDSTLGPVPGDHMFGPGVTDVGVLKGSKSLPSFRGEWFKKESKVGDASAARGGGMGGGDVGLDGGQVARSYSIWRSIKQIWSFWWSLRERLMNVARRLVMGPAPVSTLKMDPENWADDEERSGPSSASSVTGFHGGGMGAGWG